VNLKSDTGKNRTRFFPAILIGLLASLTIWVVTPYTNFVIGSAYIADSFLPIIGLFLILLIVLFLNPLLRVLRPKCSFASRELAVIVGIIMMACVVPSQGLLRMLPYALAAGPIHVRENARYSETIKEMNLPPSLFPDKMEFGADTPVSDYFATELPPGESIPWGAWMPTIFVWGLMLMSTYLMMTGLALIVYPQWRRNERLSFPLLALHQSLIDDPDEGNAFAPLFRQRSFWIAASLVLLLHIFAGWKLHNPEAVPAIPLNWNISKLFTEGLFRYLPGHIRVNRIYFIFVGIAFFMPSRIGFSVWFFVVAYAAYSMIGSAYFPPYYGTTVVEHRFGGMIALCLAVLWLGRAHWVHVFRCLFRGASTEEDRKDRNALIMFLIGCLGMVAWLIWVGVQPVWALVFLGVGFMVSLIITRFVAETGIPFIRIDMGYQMGFLRLFPRAWLSPATLFFSYFIVMFFPMASRVSCATLASHAIGLNEDQPPQTQVRYSWLIIALLAVGLFLCWNVHLVVNYHFSASLDGIDRPVSAWGYNLISNFFTSVQELKEGRYASPIYNQGFHLAFGFTLASVLQWASLTMPKWPIHPIGLLMVNTFYSNEAWFSVFLGWLIKVIILRYGGARLYRSARPVFLGLIMGEVFAGAFWSLVPVILVFLGRPYMRVQIQPY